MKKRSGPGAVWRVALALVLAFCRPMYGQVQFENGIEVAHSEYNDLVALVNGTAGEIFAHPETRQAKTPEMLKAIERLLPMVQEQMIHPTVPAMEGRGPIPLTATPQSRAMFADQIRQYRLFQLALEEPSAVQAYNAALEKGGRDAAVARVDRAAADWFNAGQDAQAQGEAFDHLRAAIKASGENVSWIFWYNIWTFNPAVSEAVGKTMLDYWKQYPNANSPLARRQLVYVGIAVKKMQLADKPFTLMGTLVSGASFSTAAWKGKVVLIDGWYPRISQTTDYLPRVQNLLAKHHAEGLEVVGIGYDQTPGGVQTFLAAHRDYKFPEIYQPARANDDYGCVVLGQFRFGVDTLGTSMLIDRKGVLHYLKNPLDAEETEAEVVKLLAETN